MKKYAVFSGRAPRAEYWWFYLVWLIADRLVEFIDKQAVGDSGWLSAPFSLALIVPWIAVTARRLHDSDRSAWWMMVLVVPLIAAFVIILTQATSGTDPLESPDWTLIGTLVLTGIGGIAMLLFMISEGTRGPNRYGPDPYGPDELEEVFA